MVTNGKNNGWRSIIKAFRGIFQKGASPYNEKIQVIEGIYVWDKELKRYKYLGKQITDNEEVKNPIAKAINLIGLNVFVIGLIAGLYNLSSLILLLTYIISGMVIGLLLVGFSEVINLLDKIYKKM